VWFDIFAGVTLVILTFLLMILRNGCIINLKKTTHIFCMVLYMLMVMVTCLLLMEEKVARRFSLDLILWVSGIGFVLLCLLGLKFEFINFLTFCFRFWFLHVVNCAINFYRKVTVMDLSKKFGLDYRLLHAIARGHSWYGNWGYKFGTGCYALTEDAYKMAVDNLCNMPLSSLSFQDRGPHNPIQSVISFYQSLAETELRTMKDLFSFLLVLVQNFRKPKSAETTKQHEQTTPCNLLCSWTRNDVEDVQQALIKVLLASGACNEAKWVTRQTLKGAVGRRIGSPELVDFGLKHLQGKSVANGMVVCSRCNPTSSAIEFR